MKTNRTFDIGFIASISFALISVSYIILSFICSHYAIRFVSERQGLVIASTLLVITLISSVLTTTFYFLPQKRKNIGKEPIPQKTVSPTNKLITAVPKTEPPTDSIDEDNSGVTRFVPDEQDLN